MSHPCPPASTSFGYMLKEINAVGKDSDSPVVPPGPSLPSRSWLLSRLHARNSDHAGAHDH